MTRHIEFLAMTFAHRIREWMWESSIAQRFYGEALAARAEWRSLRGKRLDSLGSALAAWRVLGSEGLGPKRLANIREGIARAGCGYGNVVSIARNPVLADFARSAEAGALRNRFRRNPLASRVRMRTPRQHDDPERQGDLIILKREHPEKSERGVILLKYTESIQRFAAVFDLPALARHYTLVLEPSWWGYQHPIFLAYVGNDLDVVVQAPSGRDYDFIRDLASNLTPVRVGAGDWVDPETFHPEVSRIRSYDFVMVSGWSPWKRHEELFRALAALRDGETQVFRIALVGYPRGWTRHHIDRLLQRYRLADSCHVFEGIPHEEVARILTQSSVYVLLSRREGANKAMYESLFCDTPILVYRNHRGVNLDHVNEYTGMSYEVGGLARAMTEILAKRDSYSPRRWALQNTGYARSTAVLNTVLRRLADQRGDPWSHDIVAKKNAPNLRYAEPAKYREFDEEYCRLADYLL